MLCFNCGNVSLFSFCGECRKILSEHSLAYKKIANKKVYYFYSYSDIKHLLHSKHKFHGSFVYSALAKLSFKIFAESFSFGQEINSVPVDDKIKGSYSHSAILARELRSKDLKPLYNVFRSKSKVSYSGKSLAFRQNNKRDFVLNKIPKNPIILVDDVITSGETLKQAFELFEANKVEVLFALVLANAQL